MALALPQNPAAARRQCDPSKHRPGQPGHHSAGPDTVPSLGPLPPKLPSLPGLPPPQTDLQSFWAIARFILNDTLKRYIVTGVLY
jgi:hypothetical protein